MESRASPIPALLNADVTLIGGGMVGAAAACRLAQSGLTVVVVEAQAPQPFDSGQPMDLRVSAISPASIRLLQACGAWEAVLAMRACPYRRLETWELEGMATRFAAEQLGVSELGYIVENRVLQLALWQQLQCLPNVTLQVGAQLSALEQRPEGIVCTLSDGSQITSRLLLGADGAQSRTRELAQIGLTSWDYRQACLLINVDIAGGQQDITWQQFTPRGPRAFLPLAGSHGSLVWYDTPQRVRELQGLSLPQLAEQVRREFPERLPAFSVTAAGSFALTRRHAQRYVSGRVALLGDAAHTIHPLAGQGVNLGFKDVTALCQPIATALQAGSAWDDQALLRDYERQRRRDNLLMQTTMDGFYLTFSNDLLPLRLLRNMGLLLAEHGGPLKRQALRYALGLA
jgi:2-octaprenyl-3-methyl-6-methoxy-1,4-benzoquinol hydroxylase